MRQAVPAFACEYQRMWDLVRYSRDALLDGGLITRAEYAALIADETADAPGQGSPSARRLESYDELRARLDRAEKVWEELSASVGCSSPDGRAEIDQVNYAYERADAAAREVEETRRRVQALVDGAMARALVDAEKRRAEALAENTRLKTECDRLRAKG